MVVKNNGFSIRQEDVTKDIQNQREKSSGGLPATTEALDSGNEAHDSFIERIKNRSLWRRFTLGLKANDANLKKYHFINMNHNLLLSSITKEIYIYIGPLRESGP